MNALNTTKLLARFYRSFCHSNRWSGIRYLSYHSVIESDQPSPRESYFTVTARSFRQHLEFIRTSNMKVIPLSESLKMLESGAAGSDQYIVITFDDGYIDNYVVAWPILKEFGNSAHFFIVADRIGLTFKDVKEKPYTDPDKTCMDIETLRYLRDEGATIGSHSRTHRPLTSLDDKEIMQEASHSKSRLEEIMEGSIDTFAYPFSAYNSRIVKAVRAAGYVSAFSIGMGYRRTIHNLDRFLIRRNVISGSMSQDVFQIMIMGGYDWIGTYQTLKHHLNYR